MVLAAYPDEGHLSPSETERAARAGGQARVRGRARRPAASWPRRGSAPARSHAGDTLRGTWTVAALGPGLAACFVAREAADGTYELATSYDRDLVVESALLIMARLAPLAPQ